MLACQRTFAMHKVTGSSGCAAALPTALLAEVLQHVPQQHRLTQCALVSTAWAPAAAQATVHVECTVHPDTVLALQSWLAVHAGQLLTLQLEGYRCGIQLPLDKLTQLQHLQLNGFENGFELQLPGEENKPCSSSSGVGSMNSNEGSSSSSSPAAPQLTLSSLQHLELVSVQLASVSSLLQITNAPQLTGLILNSIGVVDVGYSSSIHRSEVAVQKVADAIPRMLQQLPRVAVLQLLDLPFTDAAIQQTSAMQELKHVNLEHVDYVPECDMRHLPSSITQLQLHGLAGSVDPSLPQELPQLSALLHLDLSYCQVPPSVLGGLTQLQVLRMDEGNLLPYDPDAEWETEGTKALLTALSSLTRLQELTLHNLNCMDTETIPPEQFAAMTASSHLTKLNLSTEDIVALPAGAAQHMFPPGRQMPSLREVVIERGTCVSDPPDDDACLDAADLGCIIKACPGLQCFSIQLSVRVGTDLSPLLQLPQSCTQLVVGGPAFTDAAAPVIAQLTQLEKLRWAYSPGLTDAGLEQLMALDLDRLHIYSCGGLSEQVCASHPRSVLLSRPRSSLLLEWKACSSVPQQLDALLDNSPVLAPARLKRHKEVAAANTEQHHLQLERWREMYWAMRKERDELLRQLSAAQAGQQQQLDAEAVGQQQQQQQ